MTTTTRRGPLLQLLDRMLEARLLGPYVPAPEPSPGSGGRPWARRLRDVALGSVRANQCLGISYMPVRAVLNPSPRSLAFRTAEETLAELVSSGLILVAPPPPAWALAVLGGGPEVELAWLTLLPPVPSRRAAESPPRTQEVEKHGSGYR
jgi:hypothetical protein